MMGWSVLVDSFFVNISNDSVVLQYITMQDLPNFVKLQFNGIKYMHEEDVKLNISLQVR